MALIIFTEEAAIVPLIEGIAKQLMLEKPTIIAHEGKDDLEATFPIRLKGWRKPHDNFIILRDNDSKDCIKRKALLLEKIPLDKRQITKVRLVCQAVEAWCLADFPALKKADITTDKPFKNNEPDSIENPKLIYRNLFGEKFTRNHATRIAPHLNLNNKISPSFALFIKTIRDFTPNLS